MELVSRRRSPPASLAGGGPARVPIRYSSVSGFQGSRGVLLAPPRRFLPSAAQGDILRDLSPAVKNFFQKVLSGFEMPPFLLSIKLSERRNPRSPQTRVSYYSYSVLLSQECELSFEGKGSQKLRRHGGNSGRFRRWGWPHSSTSSRGSGHWISWPRWTPGAAAPSPTRTTRGRATAFSPGTSRRPSPPSS